MNYKRHNQGLRAKRRRNDYGAYNAGERLKRKKHGWEREERNYEEGY